MCVNICDSKKNARVPLVKSAYSLTFLFFLLENHHCFILARNVVRNTTNIYYYSVIKK